MGATVFYASDSELATITNVFEVDGTPTDPATPTVTITDPTGTSTPYTDATHTGTGTYRKDVVCSITGEWQAVWTGTGSATDADTVTWFVYPADLGKLYCTPAELKSRLGSTSSRDDTEIHDACFAASRAVETMCERVFYRSATGTVRTFEPFGLYEVKFGPYSDVVSISALATDASGAGSFTTSWSASDYQLLPLNPAAGPEQRPYTRARAVAGKTFPIRTGYGRDDRVQVTGVFGWPAVPMAVRKAALMLAEDIHKSAPYGVVGSTDFGVLRVRQNPQIKALLAPYVHPAVAFMVA